VTLLIEAAKAIGGPGSIGFFVLWAIAALAIGRFGGRWKQISRALLWTLAALYFTLSLPPVANRLAESLTSYHPLTNLAPLAGIRTVLVLDGDNRRGRVREAKRLFDELHPDHVVVSGEPWILDALVDLGLPKERIAHESESRNTREQIELVRRWPPRSVVLVASRLQMPRIAALLGPAGNDVYLAPSPVDTELATLNSIQWLIPRYSALRISRDALYELAALRYYRRVGYTVVNRV
jgi:uncharacterized SAM-binding protein YcdF (DUF218 family)